jgi:hypothetical protein
MHREGDRLVIDADLLYKGRQQRLVRAYVIFRNKKGNTYIYATNNSFHGRIMASIDLKELPAGQYRISIAGGLILGNDVLSSNVRKGHFKTEYKLTL